MAKEPSISGFLSRKTKNRLRKYVQGSGLSEEYIIEQALLHYLRAQAELPTEFITQPSIVVSRKTGDLILRQMKSAQPTAALRKLMRSKPDLDAGTTTATGRGGQSRQRAIAAGSKLGKVAINPTKRRARRKRELGFVPVSADERLWAPLTPDERAQWETSPLFPGASTGRKGNRGRKKVGGR